MAAPILDDATLPAAFRSADRASLEGQSATLRRVRWLLGLGILAAAGGITSWRVGGQELDVFAAVAGVAFAASLFVALAMSADRTEDRWYRSRAVAESVKTLAWRYAVGGDPFPIGLDPTDADHKLVERIGQVVRTAGEQGQLVADAGEQITARMRALRLEALDVRRESYLTGRIRDQIQWYKAKSDTNAAGARQWGRVAFAANVLGLLGAAGRFLGWLHIDLLGVAAAGAAGATAWVQLKQHRILASSYALAAQELSLALARLESARNEGEWAEEVGGAEEAISREHSMWLARRGNPQ